MNQIDPKTKANHKVQQGKLKEWQYVCNDPLRQEAHTALKEEFAAVLEFARSDKLTLEEGRLIKRLGESYCYSFRVSQLTIQAYQADRPHRLEVGGKHIDGSITAAGDGIIEIEISSNLGEILHRVDIIFDLTVLLDLVDRRIVDIDKEAKNWNSNLADELFTNLNFPPQSPLISRCDHHNRLDKKPLKEDQKNVVNHLLKNPFSIIWGPPGTGKSHTLLAGLAELVSNNKTVVFASNTNSAIDNVLEKIIGDNCPYPKLSEYRDNGYIVRLGAQSSKKVLDVFSPKAIARHKSEEINQKLTGLQNKIQKISREIELTEEKIQIWEESCKSVQQYNEAVKKLQELPSISEIENETNILKENQELYKRAYQHLRPVLEEVNFELSRLTTEMSNLQEKTKAASAFLQKHKTEKKELNKKLDSFDSEIQLIESSIVKKWFKSKNLEIFKSESLEINQQIAQINNQISTVELSLKFATNAELVCISKIQSFGESLGKHKDFIGQINESSNVLSNYVDKSEIDQRLYGHLKLILDYTLDDILKESIRLLLIVVERGWLHGKGDNPFTRSVNLKIQSTVQKKTFLNELRRKIESLKNRALEADKFLKKNEESHEIWVSEINLSKKIIREINNQVLDLEKQLEDLKLIIVKDSKILCLTMVKASYDRHFLENKYDVLVIDEYSMVSLPQLYCTAAITKERIVLCGDHLQLPPICQSEEEIALKWMGQSIYEWHEGKHEDRIKRNPPGPIKLKSHLAILTNQHRMPPEISYLIRPWYKKEGNSLNDEWNTNSDLYIKARSKHVLLENNVTILDTTQTNCYSSKSPLKGRYNLVHAAIVACLFKEFSENHAIDPEKIISLTPYRLQSLLTKTIFHQICPDIAPQIVENTWTIHKSQGRGEPIIIYDLTDGKEKNLSFFHKSTEPNLLNVALSRSKARIIILCSLKKMINALNSAIDIPLRSVFQKMAEIKVPVFDAKPYYEAIFKCIDIQSIFSNGSVALTEAQKNGILVLAPGEYYEALSCDLVTAKKNITIVSPFITEGKINKLEPILIQALKNSGGKLLIEIITRPPERMFDRFKDDLKRGAYIRGILDRLCEAGIKITVAQNTHEKLVVIDERISYWGSLNPLSFKDTDEINTRLEAEGLAHKLLEFAVSGQSKPYKRKDVTLSKKDIKEGLRELAKKELSDLGWTLAGFYGRPRMAHMFRKTIESLVCNPPNTMNDYFEIPEISMNHSILRNHLSEIEDIIYPIRGYKIKIKEHPSPSLPPSQLNLFDEKIYLMGKDILNSNNSESIPLDKIWKLGGRPDPLMLNVKDFRNSIIRVLAEKQGNTCKKEILPDEVLKHLNVITRGKPRKTVVQKIKQTIASMLNQKVLKEFTTTAGIKRVKLMIETDV